MICAAQRRRLDMGLVEHHQQVPRQYGEEETEKAKQTHRMY